MHPDYQQPLADYTRFHRQHSAESMALLDGDQSCTYGELDQRVNQVANGLIAEHCQPGDRIGFLGVNSIPYAEVVFGAAKAKVIYVGLNWRLAAAELNYILNDAGVQVVFCDAQFADMLADLHREVPSLKKIVSVDTDDYRNWRDAHADTDPALSHAPDDAIIQFYTSGTTGKPKGVVITNAAMSEHRRAEGLFGDWYLQSEPAEVSVNAMPNFHIGGLGWLVIGLYRGAKVILMPAPDPIRFLDLIERERVTHLFAVPIILGMMLAEQKKQPRDLSSLRVFHYGASPIAPAMLKDALEVMDCGFCQYYGMTESNGVLSMLPPEDHKLDRPDILSSCGRAIPGTELKICDADGNELPVGEAGEIWIRTVALMKEYWNRPEATADAFAGEWYKTGDGARINADGYIFMADRIRDMVITGGENVYPTEVENALFEHAAINEVAVIGVPDEKWGEALRACVVLADGAEQPADSDLVAFLRERLAGYKIPRQYQYLHEIPRTPSGKIQKFKLRDNVIDSSAENQ